MSGTGLTNAINTAATKSWMIDKDDPARLQIVERAQGLGITGTPDQAAHPLGPITLADGRTVTAHVVHAVDPVITDGNDVVMINRTRDPGMGKPALPGGFIDPAKGGGAESAVQAAAREAMEEVGVDLSAASSSLVGTRNMNRPFDVRVAQDDGLFEKYGIREGDIFMVSTQAVRFDVPDLASTKLVAGDDAQPGSARRVAISTLKKTDVGIPDHFDMIATAFPDKLAAPEIVVNAKQLVESGVPSIAAQTNADINQNGRVVAGLEIIDEMDFAESPGLAQSGRATGITGFHYTEQGQLHAIDYENPKDQTINSYTLQTYKSGPGKGVESAFIFPTQNDPALRQKIIDAINAKVEDGNRIKLSNVDKLLKEVYQLYIDHGQTPDMYNGGANQLGTDRHTLAANEKFAWGGGATQVGKREIWVVTTDNPAQSTRFFGIGNNLPKDGQLGTGTYVVVKSGNEIRKLELGYAQEALRDMDGKPFDFSPAGIEKLRQSGQTVSADKLALATAPEPSKPKSGLSF